jgi:hypothetical protein
MVLGMEPHIAKERVGTKRGMTARSTRLAEIQVARVGDLGKNDVQFTCISHLGNILRVGDEVYGYDLVQATWVQAGDAEGIVKGDLPDVVLVRKCYASKKDRAWELKQLDIDERQEAGGAREKSEYERDYEMFMEELHGDKEMRQRINVYKKKGTSSGMGDGDGDGEGRSDESDSDHQELDDEEVRLEELLEELNMQIQDQVEEEGLQIVTAEEGNSFAAFTLEEDPDI